MASSKELVDFLINHIVFPPKLPQEEDDPDSEREGEQALLRLVVKTFRTFMKKCDAKNLHKWKPLSSALENLWSLSRCAVTPKAALQLILRDLKLSDAVVIHIKAQNVGLLFFRPDTDSVLVHAFEASARSEDVVRSCDRLQWRFPGQTVSFGSHLLQDERFVEEIATMVHKLSTEPVELSMPTTKKAGSFVPEERETAHPGLVTECLMPMLESLGRPCEGPAILKHVRDDVNWDSSRLPWRRSPFWLVIRVAMQILLAHAFDTKQGRSHYKNLMAFLMAKVCDFVIGNPVSADVRMIAATKTARRLSKLGGDSLSFVEEAVGTAIANVRATLESPWLEFQKLDSPSIPNLCPTASDDDCTLFLSNSRDYLRKTAHNGEEDSEAPGIKLSAGFRLKFNDDGLPRLHKTGDPLQMASWLTDYEAWIMKSLNTWTEERVGSETDCTSLLQGMRFYVVFALQEYQGSPRAMSVLLLTILEIWKALDTICLRLHPLMCKFTPEIPEDLGNPLLLRHLCHMASLNRIETYLAARWRDADQANPPILGRLTERSFCTQYFALSDRHQRVLREIERDASERRERKRSEWLEKSNLHRRLLDEASRVPHSWDTDRWGDRKHRKDCYACGQKNQADALTIDVDEWPLPADLVQAKAAVFELDCPVGFSAWRDATWIIIQEFGRTRSMHGDDIHQQLLNYNPLQPYVFDRGQRVTLASRTKAFLGSHYRFQRFPVQFEVIAVNNALQYRLFDKNTHCWVQDQVARPGFDHHCVSALPHGPYSNLQDFMDTTTCTPNEALARQQDCHADISAHEFVAFSSLRAGERTQWMNIIRELGSADLSFNAPAVHMLLRQAALQAGSRNEHSILREAHAPFNDPSFGVQLLGLLEDHLSNVRANWKEQSRLCTIALLGLRTLSLCEELSTAARAVQLLREVRVVALEWCRNMSDNLQNCNTEDECGRLRDIILRSALTCRMTFDIDANRLDLVLADDTDVASFVESSIHLNDNYPVRVETKPMGMRQSLLADRKITPSVVGRLRTLIKTCCNGVNDGLGHAYGLTGFDRQWKVMSSTRGRWIDCSITTKPDDSHQACHYDLLTGEFLLDGRRIGRLPTDYTKTSVYGRLFGPCVLSVTRSHVPGMGYKTIKMIDGHEVHFSMKSGHLLIEAITTEKRVRLIPHEVLEPDLPKNLTEDYVHWLNPATNELEFRSLESPWDTSKVASMLHFSPDGVSYMNVGKKRLVDQNSQLGKAVLDVLQSLENRHHVMITADVNGVQVDVPRFRLSFTINKDGLLESRQLGAVIDPNQNIGCLYGLQNKLVFRNKDSHPSIPARSVVIPIGSVSVSRCGDYSQVGITLGSGKQMAFTHYQLDAKLSRLQGYPEAASKLFLAYLHAVTSSVLPDPLTSQTGTHEALRILREQSLRPSTPIDDDVISMLENIAALTPERHFYPKHLRKMQQVKWQPNLCQLAQDEDFFALVEDIVSYASQLEMLYNGSDCSRVKSRGDAHLLRRAAVRNSSVRSTALGEHTMFDEVYNARDDHSDSNRARRVHEIGSLVRDWPHRVNVVPDLPELVVRWQKINGYNQNIDLLSLTCNDLLQYPLGAEWGAAYDFCRECRQETGQFRLMRLLTMIVFAQAESVVLVRTLLGIACSGEFSSRNFISGHFINRKPLKTSYNLGPGEAPNREQIRSTISGYISEPTRRYKEDIKQWRNRLDEFRSERTRQVTSITDHVLGQWPCDAPSVPQLGSLQLRYGVTDDCARLFTAWNDNRKFMLHINEVQSHLCGIHSDHKDVAKDVLPAKPQLHRGERTVFLAPQLMELLLQRRPPSLPRFPVSIRAERPRQLAGHKPGLDELEAMLHRLREEGDGIRQKYANDLQASLGSLRTAELPEIPKSIPISAEELLEHQLDISKQLSTALQAIIQALGPRTQSEHVLYNAGLWPRINTASLLMCLSARHRNSIPEGWKRTLLSFGEAVSSLRRAERLIALCHRNDVIGFYKEAEEPGHGSWSSNEFPDWLLIEIENNLTIREIQAEVARKMIWPDDGKNAVLQLNMGEGKSSVTVPMVLTALADGQQLVRIIVIKPLLKQTQNLLSQRLGGLVDRRICHAPFTRECRLDSGQIAQLLAHFKQCLQDQGIVITLPEHMMSFRLMGRERLQTQPELGEQLVRVDQWLGATCRDVLDESDELLDPRFQLVYSIGNQRMMDGQPDRWIITQRLLALFADQAQRLQADGNRGVEVDFRSRCYPQVTFLDQTAGPALLDRVVREISNGNLLGISLSRCTPATRQAVEVFIRERSAPAHVFAAIQEAFSGTEMWSKLHLLRGLIAHNILLFAFQQKRWFVTYGLDLSRCMTAVPYRAKGVPSLSAEFGHPDVAIALTCLSYYYSGLTSPQLRQAFDNLFRESDPASEYALWARGCPGLPVRSLHGVNLEDESLWEGSVFPHLRFSKAAADYFMATVVFPHEGKEFPAKLSTSAWDMPSEARPTTGFSGTNDNKFLLPLSIRQHDLPQLHRTNAMVVSTLLQVENRGYLEAKDRAGKKLDTGGLLELVCTQQPRIQVLIDVGAQVLESENEDVAREWLRLAPDAQAAVFFDASDELFVVDRDGFIERLFASPFSRSLDSCLIYLDEVHTRGVDLNMPTSARAAVTLGPRTTKDRLVQACMRLRKLGCHQSLMFLAPPEVHQEILALSGKQHDATLNSADVVSWCFEQTCRGTGTMKPLWIMQGLEYCRRKRLCAEALQCNSTDDTAFDQSRISEFCSNIQEPEGRPLQEMYGTGTERPVFRPCLTDQEARQDATVRHLLAEWETFTESHSKDWALQEEQEREIAHEVEQERELQRPPPAVALPHKFDMAVQRFIRTGRAAPLPFPRAFDSLRPTSAFQHLHAGVVAETLYVTDDFVNTVELTPRSSCDDFIRPVKWVLSSRSDPQLLLVISPWEANVFLPEIQKSAEVKLHVYSARTSKSMHQFDNLAFYTVSGYSQPYAPSTLLTGQVALFAGSLFFGAFADYKMVSDFLAILSEGQGNGMEVRVGSDGFVDEESREWLSWPVASPFKKSPIVFFKALVGIRRKGHLYSQTHFGHLLSGRLLTEDGFRRA